MMCVIKHRNLFKMMLREKIVTCFHVEYGNICSGCIYVALNEILTKREWRKRKRGGSDGGHKHEWCLFLCLSGWPGHRCPKARHRSRGERWTLVCLHTLVYPQGLIPSSLNKRIFLKDQIPTLTDLNQPFLFYFKILKSHMLSCSILDLFSSIFNKLEQ